MTSSGSIYAPGGLTKRVTGIWLVRNKKKPDEKATEATDESCPHTIFELSSGFLFSPCSTREGICCYELNVSDEKTRIFSLTFENSKFSHRIVLGWHCFSNSGIARYHSSTKSK